MVCYVGMTAAFVVIFIIASIEYKNKLFTIKEQLFLEKETYLLKNVF